MISSCKKWYRVFSQKSPDLQVVNFTDLLQVVNKLQQICRFHQVATCHLQTWYNLLKQLAASLWITSLNNQLATSLLTTCNRLVVNKLSQAMPTHPDIWLLITSLLQDVNILIETCAYLLGILVSSMDCISLS